VNNRGAFSFGETPAGNRERDQPGARPTMSATNRGGKREIAARGRPVAAMRFTQHSTSNFSMSGFATSFFSVLEQDQTSAHFS
jgi:hypothetical protein